MTSRDSKWKDPAKLLTLLDNGSANPFLSVTSKFLALLELLYSKGLHGYLASERIGIRRRFRAPIPVISIGNLSVGGTGKTPATIAVALALQALGLKIAVLSRGHGGSASKTGAVVSDDKSNVLLSTVESGDEPMVLALALPGIPVLVGKDRRKTARTAIEQFRPDILLLDDGFQYWQLWRDIDIVLLDALKPFDNGHCLPRGLLREPKENLLRADIVIVTRSSDLTAEQREDIAKSIQKLAPKIEIYFSRHAESDIVAANTAAKNLGTPVNPMAICAVAKPESFLETLRISGINPGWSMVLPDHYCYRQIDVATIIGKMKAHSAETLVTTQKDFVKLGGLLPTVPIFVQTIKFEIEGEGTFIADLFRRTMLQDAKKRTVKNIC